MNELSLKHEPDQLLSKRKHIKNANPKGWNVERKKHNEPKVLLNLG
jgi:hypothetical protein